MVPHRTKHLTEHQNYDKIGEIEKNEAKSLLICLIFQAIIGIN